MNSVRWLRSHSGVGPGFLIVALAIFLASPARAEKFEPGCRLPFDTLAVHHPIDDSCGPEGTAGDAAQRAQNRAKNNFCASGSAVRVTYATFVRLQQAVDRAGIPYGSNKRLPSDRSTLKNLYTTSDGKKLGEGSLVRLAAFLVDAHYSNVSKGESVNCKKQGQENNDIHIALARTAGEEDLCGSVTAEISPHFRPASWTPEFLNALERHPVRLTGQLFFDASHGPCVNGRGSPRRASIWEIHPVYGIDVCRNRTLPGCDARDDSKWVPLEEWLNLEEEGPGE